LCHAAEYAVINLDPDDREWAKELSALVAAPYVTVAWPLDGSDPLVMPYPGSTAGYDDIYERTAAGCSTGARLCVYWSTGEPFSFNARRSTQAGVRNSFRSGLVDADDDEEWELDFEDDYNDDDDHDHVVIAAISELR
jgi:hypothetical protein